MKRLRTIATISILGGVLIHMAVFMVIRIESPIQGRELPPQAEVVYVGNLGGQAGPSILQQAALLDSAPLFMPTRWNLASEMDEVASLKEATEIFDPFPARVLLPEARPSFPREGAPDASPGTDPLPEGPAFVLSRFGRSPAMPPVAVSRGPSVLIQGLTRSDAADAVSRVLPAAIQATAPPVLWSPVYFYIQMAEGIPSGAALLAQSSGFAEWDETLKDFFNSLDFYRNLGDGYYRLAVFP